MLKREHATSPFGEMKRAKKRRIEPAKTLTKAYNKCRSTKRLLELDVDTIAYEPKRRRLNGFVDTQNPSVFQTQTISKHAIKRGILEQMVKLCMDKQITYSPAAMEDLNASAATYIDGPLEQLAFTQAQVVYITTQLLRNFEQQVRARFEEQLEQCLSEQYESYVQFTLQLIKKHYPDTPSYMS